MHGVKVNGVISQRLVSYNKSNDRPTGRPTAGLRPSPRAFPSGMLSRDLCLSSTPRRPASRYRVSSSLVVLAAPVPGGILQDLNTMSLLGTSTSLRSVTGCLVAGSGFPTSHLYHILSARRRWRHAPRAWRTGKWYRKACCGGISMAPLCHNGSESVGTK